MSRRIQKWGEEKKKGRQQKQLSPTTKRARDAGAHNTAKEERCLQYFNSIPNVGSSPAFDYPARRILIFPGLSMMLMHCPPKNPGGLRIAAGPPNT